MVRPPAGADWGMDSEDEDEAEDAADVLFADMASSLAAEEK